MATIRALVDAGNTVHVVFWDQKKLTPYEIPHYDNVFLYPKSKFNVTLLSKFAFHVNPDIMIISGWQDKDYLVVARQFRKKGKIVIAPFDDQWYGTLIQYFASFIGLFGFFYLYFSHAWVSGVYQYEYARRLGFKKPDIKYDLYSADLKLFHNSYINNINIKRIKYPHRFLFVGRYESIKGLNVLISAWHSLGLNRKDWELEFIGNGTMKNKIIDIPGVVVNDFKQPENLINEITRFGCFILPSLTEPWGVVVHEFAAAGLPLILSDKVGAATAFLIDGSNGHLFKSNDHTELANCLENIINSTDEQLFKMSELSYELSKRITPFTSAENLLSMKVVKTRCEYK